LSPAPVETTEPGESKTSEEQVSDNLTPERSKSVLPDDDLLLSSHAFGSSDVLVDQTTSSNSLLYQDVIESQYGVSDTFETSTDSVAVLNDGHSVLNSDATSVLPTVSAQEL
jgi:hypothetical protein